MNLIMLTISTLLNYVPTHSLPDTIILRAGNNSKVIFYGKSQHDLQNLEKLDLNKILKELNAKQSVSDSLPMQHLMLDNNEFKTAPPKPTRLQHYLENTYLNLHVGTGYRVGRYTFFQPVPARLNHPTAQLTSDIVMENLMTSSLSVVHDMKIVESKRYAFALRYGIGAGLNIQRFLHWNLVQSVPGEDISTIIPRAMELLKLEEVTPAQSDFNAFQTYIQLTPRISFKNRKALSTFYFDAGVRLNYNRNFENVNPAVYSTTLMVNSSFGATATTSGPVIMGGGYAAYSKKRTVGLSYLAEFGYKWLGLFVVYYPDNVHLNTKITTGTDRPDSGFVKNKKGNLGYISFGVKLGR
ncbi:hypothetical protein SAMN04487996_113158 [Dyadobacter soli]|uniref:Outer membrane protein beta-barrel domain-containing protein n=1 Tax=Dyadobacter soli TaxID=659014 RepID=A0A1G7PZL1_9BACT|nr:hypothetical protein [Dyadobacter soli]SDF90800.1 hypothetical protein SAMN04487996_113158 [Dyadobacter soli]